MKENKKEFIKKNSINQTLRVCWDGGFRRGREGRV